MVYELMRLTLFLCIVVAPLLFIAQIFLLRIRRSTEKRLTGMHAAVWQPIQHPVSPRPPAPPREQSQFTPGVAGVQGIDDCLPLMH